MGTPPDEGLLKSAEELPNALKAISSKTLAQSKKDSKNIKMVAKTSKTPAKSRKYNKVEKF